MKTIVFFLEEPSARAMLEAITPRIFNNEDIIKYIVFQGKQDLERQLMKKIKSWRTPETFFIVLKDQDMEDCRIAKKRLMDKCVVSDNNKLIVRIACTELESFYLGDLTAVEKAFNINGLAKKQNQKQFRSPDIIQKPSKLLKRITGERYQKMSGSRSIAQHMSLSSNGSRSFHNLIEAMRRLSSYE